MAEHARELGLTTIALTDHDTLAGVAPAAATGGAVGLRVIAGCEFSVQAPWGEMHLLGYFLPMGNPDLEQFLATQRARRADRMEEIVRRLHAAGAPVSVDDIDGQARGAALGRPHAARALVARGVVPDVATAFTRYLGRHRPAFVPKVLPAVAEVTTLVARVGGVTSAAHLKSRIGRGSLERLREAGVDGVEVRHPAHDEETAARALALADDLGLLPTGGSDWHGDGRAHEPDRARLGSVPVPAEWLERLDRLHRTRQAAEIAS